MNFMKGMLVGTILSAGVIYMMNEKDMTKKKIVKKGKQFARKMGMI